LKVSEESWPGRRKRSPTVSYNIPRRMPIKTVEVEFDADGYPGFRATVRLNVPLWVSDDLRSGDEERARAAILLIFPAWDFVDEEGEPIPHTVEGIGKMPGDLAEGMLKRWGEVMAAKAAIPKATDGASPPTSPGEPEVSSEASPSPIPES